MISYNGESVVIRDYHPNDKAQVLNLLRLNTPQYFAPEEEKDLIYYLDHERESYYVLELDKKIIGCGGINFEANKSLGKISWDILLPEFQGRGLGTLLLKHRIDTLLKIKTVNKIIVRTTQLTYKFYEKSGFKTVEQAKDYWAKGFDLYKM